MSYQTMKIHEGNLNAYYQVKEANEQRLHIVWFQLYDVLEKASLWKKEKDQCLLLSTVLPGTMAEKNQSLHVIPEVIK